MKIYLTAVIEVKPPHRAEVLEVLQQMVVATRREETCELYRLHQDMEDENRFVFYEIWTSPEGLEQHNQQPYIKAFGALTGKLQEVPRIYKTTIV